MKYTLCSILTILFIALTITPDIYAQDSHQWHLPGGAKMRLGKGAINKVAYSPDGTRLAVGSTIGVWVYDIEKGKALDLFPMYGVSCLAFSPDGKTVVDGSKSKWHNLVLWDITTGEPMHTFIPGYQTGVFSVAFSPDGKTIASGHDGGELRLWETATKHIRVLSGMGGEEGGRLAFEHTGPVHSVAFSPDGKTLASAGYYDRGTEVRLWDTARGKHIRLLLSEDGEMDAVESLAFNPNGRTLAIGWGSGGISLSDTKTEVRPQYLDWYDTREILSLAFSNDGALLASCSSDSTVCLWDVKTRKLLRTFIGHKSGVSNGGFSVAFSPDGKTVASSSKESVRLWNTQGEKHLRSVITHTAILRAVFSPDGNTLASGNEDKTVHLWDLKTHKHPRILIGHNDRVLNVAFSPDGKTLASASLDGTVLLWDLTTDNVD